MRKDGCILVTTTMQKRVRRSYFSMTEPNFQIKFTTFSFFKCTFYKKNINDIKIVLWD